MSQVREQLEAARKSLLDMSLRNKLLSFKEYKKSTVKVVDEYPTEVYETLVFGENTMEFLSAEEYPEQRSLEELTEEEAVRVEDAGTHVCLVCEDGPQFGDRGGFLDHLDAEHQATLEGEEAEIERLDDLWQKPDSHEDSADRHVDSYLQTSHDESNLQKRLYNIKNRSEALIEDAGYNALHLAIGFLEWTEAQAHDDPNRAPLILIPVSLDRKGAQSAFELTWTGAETTGNLSLELKLSEQGFELPAFERPESKEAVREYLKEVEDEVAELDGWSVEADVHLGFFDYTKFVMYQDLDPDGWEDGHSPADDELLRALLDPDASTSEPDPFDPADIDDELDPVDVHHVLDADPSQIAAIEDVKRGRNMVIEGPPGTGKSQTIVNMIAELLAEDKTVLFVSEKLAALEVVKERLEGVDIGDFALELHSDKASKSDFLDELERLAKVGEYDADIPESTFRQLSQRQRELDAYADALGSPYGNLEWTPYALFGTKEESLQHFSAKGSAFPRAEIDNPTAITPEEYQSALSTLETLSSQLESIGAVDAHPWHGCRPGQILPHERTEIETQVHQALEQLQRLQIEKAGLEESYAVHETSTLNELENALEAAELLEEKEEVEVEILRSSEWNQRPARADDLLHLLEQTQKLQEDIGSRTEPSHIDQDIPELLTEYSQLQRSFTRVVRPRWYRLKGRISTLYTDETPDEPEQIIRDLENLIELAEKESKLQDAENLGRELFGSQWRGADSDLTQLRQFSEWIVDFRQSLLNEVLTEESIDYLVQDQTDVDLGDQIESIRERIGQYNDSLDMLGSAVGIVPQRAFGASAAETPFDDIEDTLSRWQSSIEELDQWSRFDQTRTKVSHTIGAPILDLVNDGTLESDDVIPCFEGNLADSLLTSAFQERDALAEFDRNVHEDRIESFQELDEKSLELNRKRVLSRLVGGTPQLMQGASKSSQAGLLMHEFGKQRMHKPIRVLLEEAGSLVQQLKPCFMMSPLSVAKYLDPDTMDFDVVIFDEASQVRPADALGTILRGSQVVLFGDTKQLPPTSFFDQVVDHRESEDEWEFNVQDVESILDLGRSSFPTKRLKWHYRSRHESLIAVSNQEFYENELLIYPSPVQNAEELGLTLTHLPDTVYDRGASSVNRKEARAVAEEAVEHYRENPSNSLGIGTFSQAQQEAVREEVERLRKENPAVDEYFSHDRDEHFFVKNLERIQGDERDVIFISVGYGYDQNGSFNHNFGPLNNTGGWRRLNVLITRARERCVVFANFTADAIDTSKTNARGVKSLKVFLDYAENRNLRTLTDVGADPDSPFERGVIDFLKEEGFDVHPQVGCAGFRIDLAIPDPENPGRYVLGIECDGASYHSSPVARARDRQRQAILEDRGWEIYRIWSTDWYRNREKTQQRLLNAVDEAVSRGSLDINQLSGSNDNGAESPETAGDGGNPSIEELQVDESAPSVEDLAEPYEPVSHVRRVRLSEYDVGATARAVQTIVQAEGPIYRELLEQRIIEYSDVTRRGKKIKMTISKGIQNATQRGSVAKRGDFYYSTDQNDVPVRQRGDEAANIEWIPDAEIEVAVVRVLENQYATARDDLISQTARVLGFDRTGQRISDRIGGVIDEMQVAGKLERSEGLLNLP